jgi:hypothetical protein
MMLYCWRHTYITKAINIKERSFFFATESPLEELDSLRRDGHVPSPAFGGQLRGGGAGVVGMEGAM